MTKLAPLFKIFVYPPFVFVPPHFMILWTASHQVVHSRFWKLITVNTQNIGFSARKVLNVCYFYVLKLCLGGLPFMKFKVTENIKYCLSHFLCSLIIIYTYSSAWNLFMMLQQTEKWKKLISWVILVADIYIYIYIMLHIKFTQIFRKKYIAISSESTVSLLFIYSEQQV